MRTRTEPRSLAPAGGSISAASRLFGKR